MKKLILVNLPKHDSIAPPAALGALAAATVRAGWEYDVYDFSLICREHLSNDDHAELTDWLMLVQETLSPSTQNNVLELWDRFLPEGDIYGISLFSYWSIRIALLLHDHRPMNRFYGGSGCSSKIPGTNTSFHDFVDNDVCIGNGEQWIYEYLSGMKYTETHLVPNYSKFDLSEYTDKLYITGSYGCVRRCTFCDIQNMWPQFAWKQPTDIVHEIKTLHQIHSIRKFDFTDSLINGSVSLFGEFNKLLAQENLDIKYYGQFICRPRSQMPEEHYKLMREAGCTQLTVGIESFSVDVRNHMKKKFSNDDIDYHLEMSAKYGIQNVLLMLTGYPTETMDDHDENIKALYKYQKYARFGVIELVRWGTTMHLIEDTPITNDYYTDQLGLHRNTSYDWISDANPTLTLEERIRRRVELHSISSQLNYCQPRVREELQSLLKLVS